MTRRNIIKTLAAVSLIPAIPAMSQVKQQIKARDIIMPRALKPGDTAAIVAPATAVPSPEDIMRTREVIERLGLNMKLMPNVKSGAGYKSRTVEERIEDLHNAFMDPEVKAVFCIRGGYGSPEILDMIDYDLIRNNPKIFAGYSDITAMHLAIVRHSGLVTFHSPVMLSAFTDFTFAHFRDMLFNPGSPKVLANPEANSGIREQFPVRTVTGGSARGRLIGGNLSLISTLMGTPYEPDTTGKILFIEDVGEKPYSIARMLNQLRLAGKLSACAGIIFGKCSDCTRGDSNIWDYETGEVVDIFLAGLGIPVISGLMIGHTDHQLTLPEGIEAELDATAGTLTLLESAVR